MGIHKTDSGRFLVMNLGGKQQNESWVLDLLGAYVLHEATTQRQP